MHVKSNFLVVCLLVVILFPIYLYTMSPSVSVGDAGEFITSAETLSLPHAPSYPLFSLMGKCVITLDPFANLGYRVNLLSLFCGVMTAVLFFLLSQRIGLNPFSSLIVSLLLCFSSVLWEHSITAEVFSLNSFFTVLILLSMKLGPDKYPLMHRTCLSAFLLGLGLGNHHTLILVLPTICFIYFMEQVQSGLNFKTVSKLAAVRLPLFFTFFLIGFSIYFYLPVRSFKNPPIDWSNPETVKNFMRVIRRADYGSFALALGEKLPRNLETTIHQVLRYCKSSISNFSWVGFIVGILGWGIWFRKNRSQASAFFILFFLSGLGFLLLGNLPFDSQSTGILPRFYLMPAIPFVLAVGNFCDWITRFKSRFVSLIPFLLPFYLLYNAHGHRVFSRNDFTAYDYGRNLLRSLPPNAILFMDGGDDTFYTLAYLSMVEKRRPDVELHDRGGLIYSNPYGDDFRKISKSEKEARRHSVESLFLGIRPLYYSTFDKQILKEAEMAQRGILYEAVPVEIAKKSSTSNPSINLWDFYSYRGVYEQSIHRPYRLRALVPLYPFMYALNHGMDLRYVHRAMDFGTDIVWLQSNLVWELSFKAYEFTSMNQLSEAENIYKLSIQIDPKL